jgi:hypothetical protein
VLPNRPASHNKNFSKELLPEVPASLHNSIKDLHVHILGNMQKAPTLAAERAREKQALHCLLNHPATHRVAVVIQNPVDNL